MFIKLKSTILYRDFQEFGYLTDNRNFGYEIRKSSYGFVGDKVVSQSGAVFLSTLSREPQQLNEVLKKISNNFTEVDPKLIEADATQFFVELENEGFLVTGNSREECDNRDTRFSSSGFIQKYHEEKIKQLDSAKRQSTEDFFESYFKDHPWLTNVHIEITDKCNEQCVHCYLPCENRNHEISLSLFEKILKQCKEMNVLHLTISGGEPMLNSNFISILKLIRLYDFSVNVLTNLTLLTKEIIEEMRFNALLGVQVSLYSTDSKIHDAITRNKGSCEKTQKGIVELVNAGIPVQIACPIMKNNKDTYQEVVEWARKLNINAGTDYVVIAKYDHTMENLKCRLSIEEIEIEIIKRANRDAGYLLKIKDEAEKRVHISDEDHICSVCNSSICINENGDVYPCAGWQSYVVGNVKNTNLFEIWSSSPEVNHLRGLKRRDFPKCSKCEDKDFCSMCLVRNANEDLKGNPLAVNEYFCSVARINRLLVAASMG